MSIATMIIQIILPCYRISHSVLRASESTDLKRREDWCIVVWKWHQHKHTLWLENDFQSFIQARINLDNFINECSSNDTKTFHKYLKIFFSSTCRHIVRESMSTWISTEHTDADAKAWIIRLAIHDFFLETVSWVRVLCDSFFALSGINQALHARNSLRIFFCLMNERISRRKRRFLD